jgi:hypothetical protein
MLGQAGNEHDGPSWFQRMRGRDHPLCGTNISFQTIHFYQYWTGVRFRLVKIFEFRQPSLEALDPPRVCHKLLSLNDKHPVSWLWSTSFPSALYLSLVSTAQKGLGSPERATYFIIQSK